MTAPSPAWMEKSRGKPSRYPGNFLGVALATSPVLSSRFSSDSQGKRERERILNQPEEFRNSSHTRNHPWSSTWRKFPFPAFPSQSRLRLGSGWIPGMVFFFSQFFEGSNPAPLPSSPIPGFVAIPRFSRAGIHGKPPSEARGKENKWIPHSYSRDAPFPLDIPASGRIWDRPSPESRGCLGF